MNYDQDGVIRLGTDLRFVDIRKPWDMVSSSIMITVGSGLTIDFYDSDGRRCTKMEMAFEHWTVFADPASTFAFATLGMWDRVV